MPTAMLKINRNDTVMIAAGILGLSIVVLSIVWLLNAPIDNKDKFQAYKDMYESVIRGTLLSLFTTIITAKLTFSVAGYVLNKFQDK